MKASDVIRYYGSGAAAGAALGVSRAAVSRWLIDGDQVPAMRQWQIHYATGGALEVDHDLVSEGGRVDPTPA